MLTDIMADPASPIDRVLGGLRVRSELPLPELLPWTGSDRAVDVRIYLAADPLPELTEITTYHPLIQVAADGRSRFALPAVGSYLISPNGREVTVAPAPGADSAEVRLFLFGTVFAIICHRLGLLALHACCVQVGDKAIAFAGDSGIGKSTLAAGLWKRGFSLLADDITVVDMSMAGAPMVLPSFPQIKLWRDSLEKLGASPDGLRATRAALDKYHLPVRDRFSTMPLPLAKLVLLKKGQDAADGFTPLPALQTLKHQGQILYRPRLMIRLGTQAQQINQYMRLMAEVGGVSTLGRPETPDDWDRLEGALRAMVG